VSIIHNIFIFVNYQLVINKIGNNVRILISQPVTGKPFKPALQIYFLRPLHRP